MYLGHVLSTLFGLMPVRLISLMCCTHDLTRGFDECVSPLVVLSFFCLQVMPILLSCVPTQYRGCETPPFRFGKEARTIPELPLDSLDLPRFGLLRSVTPYVLLLESIFGTKVFPGYNGEPSLVLASSCLISRSLSCSFSFCCSDWSSLNVAMGLLLYRQGVTIGAT